jgi:hypothetical protein
LPEGEFDGRVKTMIWRGKSLSRGSFHAVGARVVDSRVRTVEFSRGQSERLSEVIRELRLWWSVWAQPRSRRRGWLVVARGADSCPEDVLDGWRRTMIYSRPPSRRLSHSTAEMPKGVPDSVLSASGSTSGFRPDRRLNSAEVRRQANAVHRQH